MVGSLFKGGEYGVLESRLAPKFRRVRGLGALAAAAGCVFMIVRPEYREPGWAVASILLVISLTTTFFGWPECRYRFPLEPVMIVVLEPRVAGHISPRRGPRV